MMSEMAVQRRAKSETNITVGKAKATILYENDVPKYISYLDGPHDSWHTVTPERLDDLINVLSASQMELDSEKPAAEAVEQQAKRPWWRKIRQ